MLIEKHHLCANKCDRKSMFLQQFGWAPTLPSSLGSHRHNHFCQARSSRHCWVKRSRKYLHHPWDWIKCERPPQGWCGRDGGGDQWLGLGTQLHRGSMQMFWKKNISNPTPNYFAVCGRTWRGTTRGGEGGGGYNQPADAPLVQQVSSVVGLNPYISSIPLSLKDLVGRCPWTSSRWWSRTEEATRWSATAPASRTRLSQTWSSSENTSSKRNKPKNTFGNILIS